MKPRILITNDDGIQTPGIFHLWQALKDSCDVTISAPATEQSGVGLSTTYRSPLHMHEVAWPSNGKAYSVTGTPSDCVKLALCMVMDRPPDLIVSGINRGANSGRNVLYSGTVAGVIEGIMHGIPGVAFSCFDFDKPNYAEAEKHVLKIVTHVLDHPLPEGTLLNVNFPPAKHGTFKGFKLTRQGKHFWAENPDRRQHPAGEWDYYWLGIKLQEFIEHEDSDVTWLNKGYVTAAPIHVGELTDLEHLKKRKDIFENLFSN